MGNNEFTIQAYFGDIRSQLVERIEVAKNSIKIAMAWFTNPVLFQLVLDKAAGGTKVKLLLSDSEANFRPTTSLDFDALVRKGVEIKVTRSGPEYHFMHHKFIVIDEILLITGSYNWSNNAHTNFENVIITNDTALARTYSVQFDNLYQSNVSIDINEFKKNNNIISIEQSQVSDQEMLHLAQEFNRAIEIAMAEAAALVPSLRINIIRSMITRYTAVGAAKKLSNDDEQSGFLKLITIKRADLTFEYLTATERFQKLFDKVTIKNAKSKLRPYIGDQVENL